MNYKVRLPEEIQNKIRSRLGLSVAQALSFSRAIRDKLTRTPSSKIPRIVAPIRCGMVHVEFGDDDESCGTVWFNDTKEPGVRIVIDVAVRR